MAKCLILDVVNGKTPFVNYRFIKTGLLVILAAKRKDMRAIAIAGLLILTTSLIKAQEADTTQLKFEENKHYVVLDKEPTAEPTVTEFFSLFCGHCMQFEGLIPSFKKALPGGTAFEKSHVSYLPHNNEAVQDGIVRAYVAMDRLGKLEELSKAFFIRIHLEQKDIASLDDIKAVFTENGVTDEQYEKVFNDTKVMAEATAMSELWQAQGIASVPTLVVNGKYRLNMTSIRSLAELNELVNFLLKKM